MSGAAPIRRDWLSKSLAGLLLGFSLAIALAGLLALAGPGGPLAFNKYQVVMWSVVPLWLTILSTCFLFRSGPRAWLWLGQGNLFAHALLFAVRLMQVP